MQTTDPSLLFQTSQQLADEAYRDEKAVITQNIGDPIKLSSKILDVTVLDQLAWTAESGCQARCVDLRAVKKLQLTANSSQTGKTKRLYKGHKGPVTSVCVNKVRASTPGDSTSWLALITASWDKSIRVWDAHSGDLVATLEGHTDFVKSVTVVQSSPPLLLSTSSDKTVRLWDLTPLREKMPPTCRQIVKGHTRPVETAVSLLDDSGDMSVWTADSLGVIKKWKMPKIVSADNETPMVFVEDVLGHETSVAQLALSGDDLWSASMDDTARSHSDPQATLLHPSYVKCILPSPCGLPYILTGSEDENIRVWDASQLEALNRTPLSNVVGHCGSVSALSPWLRQVNGKNEVAIVSASLDCTLRRWSMQELLHPPRLDLPRQAAEFTMTEDEERELADLLSDSE